MTRRRRSFLVVLLVTVGILLRGWNLGDPLLWNDEAESAINALTILEHGVPTDRYLDLPIFENTLTRPWTDSPEYEFKDTSYSDRGLAVYHGWLPLYAIAASFRIFGVTPDQASEPLQVRHGPEAMRLRTIAARAPSILFAAIFLVALFLAGRAFHGPNAGMLALTIGCFTPHLIWATRQARYYSATLAIGTLAMLSIWLVFRRGGWRHFLSTGLLLALLFHTHLLTFAALAFAFALTLPAVLARPGGGLKVAVTAALIGAGSLPWVWATGFFEAARRVPMAYSLLSFPADLLLYARLHPEMAVLVVGAVIESGMVLLLFRKKLPARVVELFGGSVFAIACLIGLICLSHVLFYFLTPAASFFLGRLTLLLITPAVLLAALLLDVNARVLSPRNSGIVLTVIVVAGLTVSWKSWFPQPASTPRAFFEIVNYLRSQNLQSGTRIYSLPVDHLGLMFYTGMPIQSVAPLRTEFLNSYKGDILILERATDYQPISIETIRHNALADGEDMGAEALQMWQRELSTRSVRERLARVVREVNPPLQPLPAWAKRAFEQSRSTPVALIESEDQAAENPAMFRGFDMTNWARSWPVFYYRFVNPQSRSHPNLNYESRIRSARAVVLSRSWVVYHCDGMEVSGS